MITQEVSFLTHPHPNYTDMPEISHNEELFSFHLIDLETQTTLFFDVIDISQVLDFLSIQNLIP